MAPHSSSGYAAGTLGMAALLTVLTSSQGLLTTASKRDGSYEYNFATVPFLAEGVKFLISYHLLCRQKATDPKAARCTTQLKTVALFLVPSLIYMLHNNVQVRKMIKGGGGSAICGAPQGVLVGRKTTWFATLPTTHYSPLPFSNPSPPAVLLSQIRGPRDVPDPGQPENHHDRGPVPRLPASPAQPAAVDRALPAGRRRDHESNQHRLLLGRQVSDVCPARGGLRSGEADLGMMVVGNWPTKLRIAHRPLTPPHPLPLSQGYLFGALSATLSAVAAVYTEWVMKHNTDSFYWQNMQLYFFGVIFNGAALLLGGGGDGWSLLDFFNGYNGMTWLVVGNLAFSGLLVSWVMKFADSIVKVYATSLAMLLTTGISITFFGLQPTLQLALGLIVASTSVVLYYVSPEKLALPPAIGAPPAAHEAAGKGALLPK